MFDTVVMVDWSSSQEPCDGANSIWIAFGEHGPNGPIVHEPTNQPTRQQAFGWLLQALRAWRLEGKKILVCFDLPYGYPSGTAAALGIGGNMASWEALWLHLFHVAGGGQVQFDQGNRIDKFLIADALNAQFQNAHQLAEGPFWGRPDWTRRRDILDQLAPADQALPAFGPGRNQGAARRARLNELGITPPNYPHLKMTKPINGYPIVAGNTALAEFRRTERFVNPGNARAQATWQICGNGSVGGQALLGIPYLHRLLNDPELHASSCVWPCQTGFNNPMLNAEGPRIVHAEIYPSAVREHRDVPATLAIKDARQVWTMVRTALDHDSNGTLAQRFAPPQGLTPDELERVTQEEAWILFL